MTRDGCRLPLVLLSALLCAPAVLGAERAAGPAKMSLRALKHGNDTFIRSGFTAQEDVVVKVGIGRNGHFNFQGASLVPAAAGMGEKDLAGGKMIHANGDDATPWNINGTYIGANHGCAAVLELTCAGHGKKTADLGSAWEDGAGTTFYLIKILDEDRLWFLSENSGKGDIWRFKTSVEGSSLKGKTRGGRLAFSKSALTQLIPACRIKKQQYLVNGKTRLEDDRPAACESFDMVEDYDIINPASLLQDIIKHPGKERNFVAEPLEAVINNHIVYRFHPNGANVITTTSKALQDFEMGYMGFIQSARLTKGSYDTQEYYIPKTLAFTQDGTSYDFKAIQNYETPPKTPLQFAAASKNIEDPENLPERFIQFLCRKENGKTMREVGYALGYSLIHGLTRPKERAKNAGTAISLNVTTKSYPHAVDSKMGHIPAGTQFECTAYRHYFCPELQKNATCFYWHEENGETVFYADYHKAVERDVLRLPAKLAGKALTVVEKTPSLTLRADRGAGGVVVSVTGDYGYAVFKMK